MTLDALIMLSGALVAFLSVAGFPPSWYKPMFFVLGIFVVVLGVVVRRKRGAWETAERLSARESKRTQAPVSPVSSFTSHENEVAQ